MNEFRRSDPILRRRPLLAVAAVVMLMVAATLYVRGGDAGWIGVTGRVGLMLAVTWLALPTLREPLKWLPAGLPFLMLAALMVVATQPKLLIMFAPAIGAVLALGLVRRWWNKK